MKIFTISLVTSFAVSLIVSILVLTGVLNIRKAFPDDYFKTDSDISEVVMPNLLNLKVDDAEKAARDLGIRVTREDRFVEDTSPDVVVDQFPLPGFRMKKGEAVKLFISKAVEITFEMVEESDYFDDFVDDFVISKAIIMPDITGMVSVTAMDILNNSGVNRITEREAEDDLIDKGKVISFNPPAGSEIDENTVVEVVISKGPSIKYAVVPNLYNSSLSNARSLLEKNNLKLGKVNNVIDETMGFDRVLGQSVKWGERVKEGTVIDIDLNTELQEERRGW